MKEEIIISPIKDEKFATTLSDSEIWKNVRYKPEEFTSEIRYTHPKWYAYYVKFDGIKLIQLTKVKEL